MRTLVTGATGYLGAALVRSLAEAHGPESVVGLVRDPLPEAERAAGEELEALGVRLLPFDLFALPVADFGELEFDVLYHLAAETDSAAPPERLVVNDRGTANLLESLGRERLAGRRVLLAGATAAIDRGERPRALMKEDDPAVPRTAYGRSKLEAERLLAEFAGEYGFSYAVPRFSPVWTPALKTGFLKAFKEQVTGRSILRRVGWPGGITMIRRGDAVAILRHFGETGAADGKAVMIGDGAVYRYADLLRDLRRLSGDSRWFLPMPGFAWGLIRFAAWLPVLKTKVPWRLSCLLGDDLAVDTTRLGELYPGPRRGWADSLPEVEEGLGVRNHEGT